MLTPMQTQGTPAEQIEGPPHALGGHVLPHAEDADGEARRNPWIDHAARTTAVLAVLAAVSSGQYPGQFSQTIPPHAHASPPPNPHPPHSTQNTPTHRLL